MSTWSEQRSNGRPPTTFPFAVTRRLFAQCRRVNSETTFWSDPFSR